MNSSRLLFNPLLLALLAPALNAQPSTMAAPVPGKRCGSCDACRALGDLHASPLAGDWESLRARTPQAEMKPAEAVTGEMLTETAHLLLDLSVRVPAGSSSASQLSEAMNLVASAARNQNATEAPRAKAAKT